MSNYLDRLFDNFFRSYLMLQVYIYNSLLEFRQFIKNDHIRTKRKYRTMWVIIHSNWHLSMVLSCIFINISSQQHFVIVFISSNAFFHFLFRIELPFFSLLKSLKKREKKDRVSYILILLSHIVRFSFSRIFF